jgi:hypothetical protein
MVCELILSGEGLEHLFDTVRVSEVIDGAAELNAKTPVDGGCVCMTCGFATSTGPPGKGCWDNPAMDPAFLTDSTIPTCQRNHGMTMFVYVTT